MRSPGRSMISMETTETTLIRGTGSRIISPGITTMTTSASTTMTRRSSPWTPGTSDAASSRARTSGSSTSTPRDAATATTWRPSGEGEESRMIMSNRTPLCDTSKLNNTSHVGSSQHKIINSTASSVSTLIVSNFNQQSVAVF